jgi:hypothetical protein
MTDLTKCLPVLLLAGYISSIGYMSGINEDLSNINENSIYMESNINTEISDIKALFDLKQ